MDTFLCNQLTNGSNKCLWLVLGGGLVLIQCARMHLSSKRTAYLKIANCIVISRRTAERVVGPAFVYGLSFCVLGLCSGSEDALGPSRPVSTAGSRCVVCGLMFSPTSPAEGAPDLFISAGEAAVSNSSGYLFGRLYTALAALCSLTCGPMCGRPHAL